MKKNSPVQNYMSFLIIQMKKMSNIIHAYKFIDFLSLPRPHVERRKSIYSPWGWGIFIDFQAI